MALEHSLARRLVCDHYIGPIQSKRIRSKPSRGNPACSSVLGIGFANEFEGDVHVVATTSFVMHGLEVILGAGHQRNAVREIGGRAVSRPSIRPFLIYCSGGIAAVAV